MLRSWLLWAGVVGAVTGCYEDLVVTPLSTNAPPLARAGTGGTIILGAVVTLDSSDSLDPDGALASVQWRIDRKAAGSRVALGDPAAATHVLTLDVIGTYVFALQVRDSAGAVDEDVVTFTVIGPLVPVDAGEDRDVGWRVPVELAGSFTAEDPAGATYAWSVVSRPPESFAAISDSGTATASFEPDRVGDYLYVTVGIRSSSSSTTASCGVRRRGAQISVPTP